MNRTAVALSSIALLILLAGGIATAGAATPGFAVYGVQLSTQGYSYSLTVNETVAKTSSPSYDELILSVMTGAWNSSYSRSINSSSDVSPFLPAITNQTFSYASGSGNITLSISKNGTVPVDFQGGSYSLTTYAVSVAGTYNGSSSTLNGAIAAFQSGLVYSVKVSGDYPIPQIAGPQGTWNSSAPAWNPFTAALPAQGTASLSLTLLSTSLPLNASSASTAAQVASIGIGAGAAVSAIAIGLGVRYRGEHREPSPEVKPEHWVD